MAKGCFDAGRSHVCDSVYRKHEIVISKCNNCPDYIFDVRRDDFDGDFIAGFITPDIVDGVQKSLATVDDFEKNRKLMETIPF